MSYSRSRKHTTAERQLQSLKTQLYGKEASTTTFNFKSNTTATALPAPIQSGPATSNKSQKVSLDASYLKKDLLKIALLATLAIGIQFLLYFSVLKKF